MAHLSPSVIFSPSVARQQLAAAKDWNYVDNWLSIKFDGKTRPPFERNNDTLKALLALAALNESADEERELLAKVEAKALQDLQGMEKADANALLLKPLEDHLPREGQASLELLANLSVTCNQAVPNVQKLASRVIDLQISSYNLDQATERITIMERHFATELARLNGLILHLQNDASQPDADIAKQTIEYQRKLKILTAKLPDLRDRLTLLSASTGRIKATIQDVQAEEDIFRDLVTTVKELEDQVKSYHGLPQDTDLARLELETLRVELRAWTRQRDSMFEGLVERQSPKKTRS